MARLLRHEHQAAAMRVGLDGHNELRAIFDLSAMRRAWLADGKLIGLGGVVGTVILGAAELFLDRLKNIEATKRMLDDRMVIPDNRLVN
jgi:hypothetical protein